MLIENAWPIGRKELAAHLADIAERE